MDSIDRTIQASWRHRVIFTDCVFDPANPVLRDTLSASRRNKTLVVVDDSLAGAMPAFPATISKYFAIHEPVLPLVCLPLVRPGGEQAKSSWGDVAELHRAIDIYHLDRHSFVVGVGGGALLDQVGLA